VTSATNRFVSLLIAALLSVACNLFWAPVGLSGTFTAFGPQSYQRGSGSPAPVVTPFTIPNPLTTFTLRIYNGGRAGTRTSERVSSAVITLNDGAVIVGAQNINENIGEIDCVFLTTDEADGDVVRMDVGQIPSRKSRQQTQKFAVEQIPDQAGYAQTRPV
jgi:hypothetical protein